MKHFLLVFIISISISGVIAQDRQIARGAEPGEFYMSGWWYGTYDPVGGPPYWDTIRVALFRLTENGKKLTIQYDMDSLIFPSTGLAARYIYADATPGVIYCRNYYVKSNGSSYTSLWASFDYGKNWTFREELSGQVFYCTANVEGLVYKGDYGVVSKSIDYGQNFNVMENITWVGEEPGLYEDEFFSLIGRGFYHTSDCYQNYINITIDEEFVSYSADVFRGGLPGEVYISSTFNDTVPGYRIFKVSFSADTDTFYLDENLPAGDYKYHLLTHYEGGCISEISNTATVTVVVGIGDTGGMKERIVVYPNPTTGMINVQCLMINVQNIEIFDLMGRKVFEQKAEGAKAESRRQKDNSPPLEGWQAKPDGVVINISHLPTGLYFVRITTENSVVVRKVIKN